MLYDFWKAVNVETAQKIILSIYIDDALNRPTVHRWFGKIINGEFTLEVQPCSGRPSEFEGDVVITLVNENPQITNEEIATGLKVNNSTAFCRLKRFSTFSSLVHKLSASQKVEYFETLGRG